MPGIGLLNEKPLHAALKAWYARPGDRFEVPVDGYVIDLVRGDLLIEIQTRNFGAMKQKLRKLTATRRVRLVYPIACEKWVVKPPTLGIGRLSRRKSPRRGRVEDLFRELVSVPWLPANSNFSLEVLLIREEEVRRLAKRRRWRTPGWRTEERRLIEVVDRRLFETAADWRGLLPASLGATFTTRDLSTGLEIDRHLAQQMAYCLRGMGVIDLIGKQGRGNLYRIAAKRTRRKAA
jgi:hypothetical protein